MEKIESPTQRQHSEEFKAQVLAECAQPGVSIAAVALSHGLNINLVHKWRRKAGRQADDTQSPPARGRKSYSLSKWNSEIMHGRRLVLLIAVSSFLLGGLAALGAARLASSEYVTIILSAKALNEINAGVSAARSGSSREAIRHIESAIILSEDASPRTPATSFWGYMFPLEYLVVRGLGLSDSSDKLPTSRALLHGVLADWYLSVGEKESAERHMRQATFMLNAPEQKVRELSRQYIAHQ